MILVPVSFHKLYDQLVVYEIFLKSAMVLPQVNYAACPSTVPLLSTLSMQSFTNNKKNNNRNNFSI